MDWFLPILAATFRLTTPIAFATLGAVVMERAGINALPMEGIMLPGWACCSPCFLPWWLP